ncbi:MAG: T9SS type A sorting domain-containing protein [Bacteroidia bacterium]
MKSQIHEFQKIKNMLMSKTQKLLSILSIALLSFTQFTIAQTPSWKWVKWSDGTQTTAKSACADASGNLYATGTFYSTTLFDTTKLTAFLNGAFVVKYSASGSLIWAKMMDNTSVSMDSKSIAIDPAGNLYVTGAYTGTLKIATKTLTGSDQYLAKFDNNGVIQWVVNTSASNGVSANSSGIFVAGGNIIQKFDATGTLGWTITGVKSNQGYTNFFSLAINTAGNLVVAGDINDKWTFGTTVVTGGNQNIILMEVSAAGVVNWAKVFGNNIGGSHAQHIAIDGSDNIIMTGKIGGLATATCTFGTLTLPAKNSYLVKLNSTGVTQWGTVMTNAGDISGSGVYVATDANGAVYTTTGFGGSGLSVTDGGTKTYVSYTYPGVTALILKFNSAGVFQSALTNKGNTTANNSRGLALAANGTSVYFAGVCSPTSEWGTLSTPRYGSVFAKIDGTSSGEIRFENSKTGISVYPNPSTGIFTLDIRNSAVLLNSKLSIVNTLGEIVFQADVKEQLTNLNLEWFPKGIYFLQVSTDKGITTKKLIVE